MSQTDSTPTTGNDSIVVAGLVLVLGVATAWGGWQLDYWTPLGPGPGFFPFWLGLLLGLLGAIWIGSDLRARRRTHARVLAAVENQPEETPGASVAPPTTEGEDEQPYDLRTSAAIVVSLCILAGLLDVIGYQLSMLLFLFFHLFVMGRRGLLLALVISLAGSFGVFVIFTRLLTVALPTASIPFLAQLGL